MRPQFKVGDRVTIPAYKMPGKIATQATIVSIEEGGRRHLYGFEIDGVGHIRVPVLSVDAANAPPKAGKDWSTAFYWLVFSVVAAWFWYTWAFPSPERRAMAAAECRLAAACKQYSMARLECAPAGNFKNCLRVKMGDDVGYIDTCSGFNEGAPAVPRPNLPGAIQCFIQFPFGQ